MRQPMDPKPFPVVRACDLAAGQPEQPWLFHQLWAAGAVGLIGGAPKSFKTWMGLEMAVSLASATPCLGAYPPARRGKALLFLAEDADHVVRARLESLCRHRGVALSALDLFVITTPTLRIDLEVEQRRLRATLAAVRPDLLLLDPLVRLHRRDENSAADVSALLAFLRELQREFEAAVVLVHHTRKNGASNQPGQALRGSGDLHAFGDSNLYLQRKQHKLVLSIEHRAAPSPPPVELQLSTGETPHLELIGSWSPPEDGLARAVRELLVQSDAPLTRAELRDRLQARNERVGEALARLEQQGVIERTAAGWRARSIPAGTAPAGDRAPDLHETFAFPRSHLGDADSGTRPEAR
jgi:hypothetical protein